MADPGSAVPVGRARDIEEGLLSPCCWMQTLDIHDSEIARDLRREISVRVANGESSQSIREDIAARYGERIIAVPASSPLPVVAPVVTALVAVMAIVIVWKARRWRKASRAQVVPQVAQAQEALAYDDALNQELRALGD